MSKCLESDQEVGPYLGPNCLAKVISRQQKLPLARKDLIATERLTIFKL